MSSYSQSNAQAQQVSISENKVSRNFENPILLKIEENYSVGIDAESGLSDLAEQRTTLPAI